MISNAIRYRMVGGVRIELTERRMSVEVVVESVGPVIEPDEIARIFERRYRGKWATRVREGTGVGLYLASVVAKANGFDIRVSSAREGSWSDGVPLAVNRFSFEVPTTATP